MEISRIGFGCWAIGGHGYGKVDDSESIKAIHETLDLGINFFDTADVYGFGHSEEILCKGLGSKRKDVVIATKFGVNWDAQGNIFRDCSPGHVVEAIEGSLRRLNIDCIPLYQIHWYDDKTQISKTMEILKKCQESGKIRYIGCSNITCELVKEMFKTHRIESIQFRYSVIYKDLETDMLRCIEKMNMGAIAYGVLLRGLLSGKYRINCKFKDNDTRKSDEDFKGEKLRRNFIVIDALKCVAERYNKTPSQVAIRWVLDNPAVTCALSGIKKAEQIVENSGALGWKLNEEDRNFLSKCLNNEDRRIKSGRRRSFCLHYLNIYLENSYPLH